MGVTFVLALFGWILFRAESVGHAVEYVKGIFSPSLFDGFRVPGAGIARSNVVVTCVFILVMFLFEWIHREQTHPLSFRTSHRYVRYAIYLILVYAILILRPNDPLDFIYFQF
jgi:preprotein translocase subunit SecG